MPYSTNKGVINKIRNTLKYSENVIQSGEIYISDNNKVPIEVRTFLCGNSQPPFPHGDDL
jgi:hypothetical protein